MHVVMIVARVWQNAGRELQLGVGRTYELPDVVAHGFIAAGAAEPVETPEIKPDAPPETGRKRTR